MKNYLIKSLEQFIPYDKLEECELNLLKEFLDNDKRNNFYNRNNYDPGHITCSALVLNESFDKVLINHHKKYDRWLHFGGHWDNDWETPYQIAIRELCEEVFNYSTENEKLPDLNQFNIRAPFPEKLIDIGIYHLDDIPNLPHHTHYDLRYLFILPEATQFIITKESIDIKWIECHNAQQYLCDPQLLRMIEKSQKMLQEKKLHA